MLAIKALIVDHASDTTITSDKALKQVVKAILQGAGSNSVASDKGAGSNSAASDKLIMQVIQP